MTYTYPTNITRFNELLHYASDITDGTFGIIMLLVIFTISFLAMRQASAEYPGQNAKIFSACTFITMFFSVCFFLLGIVNDGTMYICIFLTAIAVFANLVSGR